ncbi:hypothetical protein [Shewanella litorisediminis]|uniref:Uncharacterized protein n=1 Tax=Shewanella litorisediminis TaxID=1173586 RepID=A0ABX7G514_9GAMM|nr:hypothetical protein [Shewanella litorisediminis]MCL2917983.1 hypothetical protein [Shewanella litorisediminis]QRH02415.1 hypothetical protein JQC75_03030 [Shewanella litorisediminis]
MRLQSLLAVMVLTSLGASAGQVVVRKSDEAFDAFAVRDQLAREHQWQEALRAQQQLEILQSLPLGCVLVPSPYRHFSCKGFFYRPYPWQGRELYISVPNPEAEPQPVNKPK